MNTLFTYLFSTVYAEILAMTLIWRIGSIAPNLNAAKIINETQFHMLQGTIRERQNSFWIKTPNFRLANISAYTVHSLYYPSANHHVHQPYAKETLILNVTR